MRGFTLIELLIVVVILGILAAVAIPHFRGETGDAKQTALDQDLAIMNKAIELYRLEHGCTYPGTIGGETSWETFVTQMTAPTDKAGKPGSKYGPYLRTGIPINPFTATRTGVIKGAPKIVAGTAWVYDPAGGIIEAASMKGAQEIIVDPDTPPEPDPEPKGTPVIDD
jgi:general secretion pathway protein G